MKILVALNPHYTISLSIVSQFNFSHSSEAVVLAYLGSIFISLKTIDIENIFMFLLAIHILIFSWQNVCLDLC